MAAGTGDAFGGTGDAGDSLFSTQSSGSGSAGDRLAASFTTGDASDAVDFQSSDDASVGWHSYGTDDDAGVCFRGFIDDSAHGLLASHTANGCSHDNISGDAMATCGTAIFSDAATDSLLATD